LDGDAPHRVDLNLLAHTPCPTSPAELDRAAAEVGVSQPAIGNTLRRRHLLGDELLIRVGKTTT